MRTRSRAHGSQRLSPGTRRSLLHFTPLRLVALAVAFHLLLSQSAWVHASPRLRPHPRLKKPAPVSLEDLGSDPVSRAGNRWDTLDIPGARLPQQQGETPVDGGIVNLRALLGGGRKIARHDCPEGPGALSVVYTKAHAATGGEPLQLWYALSTDNGVTWQPTGPLSAYPDSFRDHSQCVGIGATTYIGFSEQGAGPGGISSNWLTRGEGPCLLAFEAPFEPRYEEWESDRFFLQQAVVRGAEQDLLYWSWIDFRNLAGGDPYDCYFQWSANSGLSWTPEEFIEWMAAPVEFHMEGTDGALVMAAEGRTIWGFLYVNPDSAWAVANGWFPHRTLPAYTVSTDAGYSWAPLRLLMGPDGMAVERGHTGDPDLDVRILYNGGTQDAGYSAFNNTFDNVIIVDGVPHFTFTVQAVLNDSLFLGDGIFHGTIASGEPAVEYVGFPEDTSFSTDTSGVAFFPMISRTERGDVLVSWGERGQQTGQIDIWLWARTVAGLEGRRPIRQTPEQSEQVPRAVDVCASTGAREGEFVIDYLYINWCYGGFGCDGGYPTDSLLWHYQKALYLGPAVGVSKQPEPPPPPTAGALAPNFPNPFNPATTIPYALPGAPGQTVLARLEIFSLRGKLVRTLVTGDRQPGRHEVAWDGSDDDGRLVPSGNYFARLSFAGGHMMRKILLLR